MKIYTKTGDTGETSLLGGQRVEKDHLRIEAYGTVDELNAFVAHLIAQLHSRKIIDGLNKIQNELFILGSILANPGNKSFGIPEFKEEFIEWLEHEIDAMDQKLDPLKNFVLPTGVPSVSAGHICRTITRRAERRVISLSKETDVAPIIVKYLNRLSDYFFVLSRYISKMEGISENLWKTNKSR